MFSNYSLNYYIKRYLKFQNLKQITLVYLWPHTYREKIKYKNKSAYL